MESQKTSESEQEIQEQEQTSKLDLGLISQQSQIKKTLLHAQERRRGFSITPLEDLGTGQDGDQLSRDESYINSIQEDQNESNYNSSNASSKKESKSESKSISSSESLNSEKIDEVVEVQKQQPPQPQNSLRFNLTRQFTKLNTQEDQPQNLILRLGTFASVQKKTQEVEPKSARGKFEILLPSLKRQLQHQVEYQQQQSILRSVDNIKKNHRKINQIVDNLEFKMNQVLDSQQTNMVSAYKVSSQEFRKQKQTLVETVQDLESMQELNEKIVKYRQKSQYLENQLKQYCKMYEQLKAQNLVIKQKLQEKDQEVLFYQNESKKLLKENTSLQFKLNQVQGEIEQLNENNSVLKSQLISVQTTEIQDLKIVATEPTPKNKTLELNHFDFNSQYKGRGFTPKQAFKKTHSIFSQFQKESQQNPLRQKPRSQSIQKSRACGSCTQQSIESITQRPLTQSQINKIITQDPSQQNLHHELQLQKLHENYQGKIQQLQSKYKQLLESRTQAYTQKSELEDIFVNCISQVKKKISKRKVIDKNKVKPGDFQFADKQQLIELFLTDELVIAKIYEILFPQKSANSIDFLKVIRNAKTPSEDMFQSSIMENISSVNTVHDQTTDENRVGYSQRAVSVRENRNLQSFIKQRGRRFVKSRPEHVKMKVLLSEFG